MNRPVRVIHYGIGAIGAELVRLAVARPEIEVVGAIDTDPQKAGRDLGEVMALGRTLGVNVRSDAVAALRELDAGVVVHATGSNLAAVSEQLCDIIAAGKSVVSSCEELSFPWYRHPDIAADLDRRAREAGVRVLGSGVNPGFLMDSLPLALATVCQEVRAVRAARIVDTSKRRRQLQLKTGAGITEDEFRQRAEAGQIGHVGLAESACMVADALGWPYDGLRETLGPVVARDRIEHEGIVVEPGQVAGVSQTVTIQQDGREVVRLDLEMSIGADNPRDEVSIDGTPPLTMTVQGGVHGDLATVGIMLNCVPALARSAVTGLLTMRDIPMVPYLPEVRPSTRTAV